MEGNMIDSGVGQLREQARAAAITAGDPGYDQGRAMHNGMSGKHPLVVIRAEQAADIIAGANFASNADLELAARGSRHGAPGFGTCHGGVVIDLSPMRPPTPVGAPEGDAMDSRCSLSARHTSITTAPCGAGCPPRSRRGTPWTRPDGPLECAKISCLRGHHFIGPVACLTVPRLPAAAAVAASPVHGRQA